MKKLFIGLMAMASMSAFAQTAPDSIGIDNEEVRNTLNALGSRINALYVGSDNYGGQFRGVLGVRGALFYETGRDELDDTYRSSLGVQFVPFEVDMDSEGRKRISVGILNAKNLIESGGGGIIDGFRSFIFEYNDRNPKVMEKSLTGMEVKLKASLLSNGRDWIGPQARVGLGSTFTDVDIRGTQLAYEIGADEIAMSNMGFLDTMAGIAGQYNAGNLSLKGAVGYNYYITQGLNNAEKNMQTESFSDGEANYLLTGRKTRSVGVDLGAEIRLKNGNRLEVFYAGEFAKKDMTRGAYNGVDYDITNITVRSPHNAGVRYKF